MSDLRLTPSSNDPVSAPSVDLASRLDAFFNDHAPLRADDTVLVAFSGGPDSTALLAAMCAYAPGRGIRIAAAHIDHQLDSGSAERARAAARAAAGLGIDLVVTRSDVADQRLRSESPEMAARRIRYRELERIGASLAARYIATAHHRDDQAETVLLRIAAGHGPNGLGGVPARRDSIVRPLLEASHLELVEYARRRGLEWIEDRTNQDLAIPRNRMRHRVLPALESRYPLLKPRLADLADAARRASGRLGRELDRRLAPELGLETASIRREALEALPAAVIPEALVHLLRSSGSPRRPSKQALGHVVALIGARAPIGVDLGGGWRIEDAYGARLRVLKTPMPTGRFAYTLGLPGEVRLGELASSLRLRAGRKQPWMFQGDPLRAGFSLTVRPGELLTVRNRRPGDRVRPLGSTSRRKLKNLLIDHGVPKHQRDRLPLLCNSRRILWVPGITIDHDARIRDGAPVWVAEIIPDE